ncbi:MAG: DUF3833 family protein, partial [Hyphomonadaceae bacterium]
MFKALQKAAALTAVALSLAGCATTAAAPTAKAPQQLVLEDYFKGKTTAWGVFQDRNGTLIRQFKVDI